MKIKRDPARAEKAEIEQILRNHEWLFHELHTTQGEHHPVDYCAINYELLADLIYEMRVGGIREVVN